MKKYTYLFVVLCCVASLLSCKKDSPVYVATPPTVTVLDIIKVNPSFTLFYEAVKRTNTAQYLNPDSSYTVLAPDNNAFANAGITTAAQIDNLDTAYLKKLILYGIIPKPVASADVPTALGTPYTSLLGPALYFSRPIPGSDFYGYAQRYLPFQPIQVNGDTVVSVDTKGSNGYIHVLNRPLRLPATTVQALLSGDSSYSYFVAALKRFNLYDQLSGPGPYTVFALNNAVMGGYGLTPDSIGRMDTAHYEQYLFGVYILTPNRIFSTDFLDGPEYEGAGFSGNGDDVYAQGAFFSAGGVLTFCNYGNLNYGPGEIVFNVFAPNPTQQSFTLLGPVSNANGSNWTQITDPDLNAANGVVHGLSNILVYPYNVQK